MTNDNDNATRSYFDYIATGVAYINRVKQIVPQAGQRAFDPYWTATLAVLVSRGAGVQYRSIDCTIPAEEARQLLCYYAAEANALESNVLAGFRIADPHAGTFVNKAGEVVPCMRGRLIRINWLKVNGKMVFKAEPAAAQASSPTSR